MLFGKQAYMNSVVGALLLVSLLGLLISSMYCDNSCYTDNQVIIYECITLHFMLFSFNFFKGRLTKILIISLILFFVTRFWVLQLDFTYYVYTLFDPKMEDMEFTLAYLIFISFFMLLGSLLGEALKPNENIFNGMHLFSSHIRNDSGCYIYMMSIYIVSKLLLILLFFDSGIGMGVDIRFFDSSLLRLAKISKFASPLGYLAIAWLVINKPIGKERIITLIAISFLVMSQLTTGSKVALLYVALMFFSVYYAGNLLIPKFLKSLFIPFTIVSLGIIFPLMGGIRVYFSAFLTGNPINFYDAFEFSYDPLKTLLDFDSRLGTAFDALLFSTSKFDLLKSYSDITSEFLDIFNGYYPGGIFDLEAPIWARILYAVGHNADLQTVIATGTGENIGLMAHLLLSFDWLAAGFLVFFLMFFYGIIYSNCKVVFIRAWIVTSIFIDISNGSGVFHLLSTLPFMLIQVSFLYIFYLIYDGLFHKNSLNH